MATVGAEQSIRTYVLDHFLQTLRRTPGQDEPFSHFYMENVFPDDLYADMMQMFPDPKCYKPLSVENYHNKKGGSTRDVLSLDEATLAKLPDSQRDLWEGIGSALRAPELKTLVFQKLSTDLATRFGCRPSEVNKVPAFPKASLFRDTDGYEIAPHPDGRRRS